jgi:glycosyltransferase involved in cell wall biosynthesis
MKQPDAASLPLVSVILPTCGGVEFSARAVRSVQRQSLSDWELLLVGGCANDCNSATATSLDFSDARIRVLPAPDVTDAEVARAIGVQQARGRWLSYLDSSDEYFPNYLENLLKYSDRGDVLLFAYDIVAAASRASESARTWDPVAAGRDVFAIEVARPLGIAHRTELLHQSVGYIGEPSRQSPLAALRRLVQRGTPLVSLLLKSGRRHLVSADAAAFPSAADCLRAELLDDLRAAQPIQGGRVPPRHAKRIRRIAFVSSPRIATFTDAASAATLEALPFLQRLDFECQAFCGLQLDARRDVPVAEDRVRSDDICTAERLAQTLPAALCDISIEAFESRRCIDTQAESTAFLAACEAFLAKNRPDVVWTHARDPDACEIHRLAKGHDMAVVCAVHDPAGLKRETFACVDYAIAPTRFLGQLCWETLGLVAETLPVVLNPQRVRVEQHTPHYVTFVGPESQQGLQAFAKIAAELFRQRPDIPLLAVTGPGGEQALRRCAVDLQRISNLTFMPPTADARTYLAQTMVLSLPSGDDYPPAALMAALFNGIPIVAGNHSALPELVGDAGFLLDSSARNVHETTGMPTDTEVSAFVQAIVALCHDRSVYQAHSAAARLRAKRWRPEILAPQYRAFFENAVPRVGPPLTPARASCSDSTVTLR